ncbi:MAG: flagellar export chaperone FliS [Pseudomonadales bacterium]
MTQSPQVLAPTLVRSMAATGSPHQMVSMLLGGALGRLARARDELLTGAGQSLAAAVSIIEALQGSLDMDRGGQLAANLFDLYDYMLRRLEQARIERDPDSLAEVSSLLETILEGWEAIAPEVSALPA